MARQSIRDQYPGAFWAPIFPSDIITLKIMTDLLGIGLVQVRKVGATAVLSTVVELQPSLDSRRPEST